MKLLTNPIMVNIELTVLEDVIEIIYNSIHPSTTGGAIKDFLNNLDRLKEKAIQRSNCVSNADSGSIPATDKKGDL